MASSSASANSAAAPSENPMTVDEAIRLLRYLTRAHLRSIVDSALPDSPPLLASLSAAADAAAAADRSLCCLLVRCVNPLTTLGDLDAAFSPFGPVDHRYVKVEPADDRLAHAVVEFRHPASAVRALENPSRRIAGRVTSAYLAAGPDPLKEPARELRTIFVTGFPPEMTADQLIDHLETFGEIELGPTTGFDRAGRCEFRPAIFVYKTKAGADAAVDGSHFFARLLPPRKLVNAADSGDN